VKYKRGSDDDRRQIIADLISSDDSPFTPDDLDALNLARDEILRHWRDEWLKPKKAKPAANLRTNCDGIDKAELQEMVSSAVSEALAGHGIAVSKATVEGEDEEAKAMSSAATAEALAAEAEARGDTRRAQRLRTMAANDGAQQRARDLNAALAYPARTAAVANADDPDVKAMGEFGSADAVTKAINAKRERQERGE
jgi:hypothetical protein